MVEKCGAPWEQGQEAEAGVNIMKKEARAVLSAAGIDAGKDFDQLSSDQLAAIHAEAAAAYQRKYRKPISNSSATYVRRRYELLQQRAYR